MDWANRLASKSSNSDVCIGIIGLCYVGLPTAIGFHDAGFTVWGVDVSQKTVDTIRAGKNPTGDPDVDDIVPKPGTERWHITTSAAEAVPHCDVILVTVPTPITHDLKPDLSYVAGAGTRGGRRLRVCQSRRDEHERPKQHQQSKGWMVITLSAAVNDNNRCSVPRA